jgi:protein O-mannosyl-transferase
VVNLLLYTLNVLLRFWVLLRATRFVGRSAMVAGLFALHPINVQSVAWVAERKNLLSMFFFLLALGAYRWYAESVPQPSRGEREIRSIGRYLVVVLLFALGLMAKPQIITLPLVLLLWDYWPLQRTSPAKNAAASRRARRFRRLTMEKLPLFAFCAASAVLTLLAHRSGSLRWLPLCMRLANAIGSYMRYVKLAFWPLRLAVFYPHPQTHLTTWEVLAAFLFLAVVTWLVIGARRRPYLLVGWFGFLITLLPMIGLVQVGAQGMADRYAYLPFIGCLPRLPLSFLHSLSSEERQGTIRAGPLTSPGDLRTADWDHQVGA